MEYGVDIYLHKYIDMFKTYNKKTNVFLGKHCLTL